ncbi:MAG: NAD(P)/FAD-dependent oxidoreductase [Halanaerobiaceae bacterium]
MSVDVVIIGGGVVGTAVARELSRFDLEIVLLEKEADVACGTSKANSGIIHAGYNASGDMVKGRMNVRANPLFEDLCQELNVPFKRIGSLVVGFNKDDLKVLKKKQHNGEKLGIKGLEIWDREQLLNQEPNINPRACCALFAPSAGIISPYELAIGYADNAALNGVDIKLNTEVTDIMKDGDRVYGVKSNLGEIRCKLVINAAGVFADEIAQWVGDSIKIIPRKGEYHLYDKQLGSMVNHILFPIPTETSKGILVTPTVHGNLLVGPNSYHIEDKEDISTTDDGLEEVYRGASRLVPDLPDDGIITSFSGLRAVAEGDDFIIGFSRNVEGLINVAGIQSPGLSSVPAIADKVLALIADSSHSDRLRLVPRDDFREKNPVYCRYQDVEEEVEKWKEVVEENGDYGEIVCRCESVTRGEIIDALRRPVPAKTLDAIKRRTRAGSGRCQGGFCQPRVVKIIAGELGISPLAVTKSGGSSVVLSAEAKELIKKKKRESEQNGE